MKSTKTFKKIISAGLAFTILLIGSVTGIISVSADEIAKYPYTVFGRNELVVNASNMCINGNIHTNREP
jgi:hypothetical protein